MTLMRPMGPYAELMLDPGGWPDVDEDHLYQRSRELMEMHAQVCHVYETCLLLQLRIFEPSVWSGATADAADGELQRWMRRIALLTRQLQELYVWHEETATATLELKDQIYEMVSAAQYEIEGLETQPEGVELIEELVIFTHEANVAMVEQLGAQIGSGAVLFPECDLDGNVRLHPADVPSVPSA
ncbi:ESX-1 secretion-associated protein EspK [Mycobacterium basiliense]|uniref:ESX-1 secretion-associated protein EspK n=1 Tax=Mycobacterium basiliense TaxID=2094119 RepID=A0A3S4CA21_9MYCO|nr:hypothetical protein [Mycobacterium basiliense]VDM87807.1 ESX-1 secretion-associated protein EspK [Mycobacterium basiliense]